VTAVAREHKFGLVAGAVIGLILLVAAGFGLYSLLSRKGPAPFENFTITQVTTTGKAEWAAISPDGKYVLNAQNDNGLQSLWLRNVPTGSDTQIVPPASVIYASLAFSPDGNYVYFRKAASGTQSVWDLYRTPVLGGTPQVIVRDLDTGITFSPDGHRFAFMRGNDPELGKYRLLAVNPDGSDETILRISDIATEDIPRFVSWSPDGKQIAYSIYALGGALGVVKAFDIADKQTQPLASLKNDLVHEIAWMPGGQWIMTVYNEKGPAFGRPQLGLIPRIGGNIRPVTRDTNSYNTLTLSADGKTAATVQVRTMHSLELLAGDGTSENVPPQTVPYTEAETLDWTAEGQLLVSDGSRLLRIDIHGGQQTPLLGEPDSAILDLTRCGNSSLVFSWAFHAGSNQTAIWRANADGSDPKQLSEGGLDTYPTCSPGGKWVFYYEPKSGHVMRVAGNGGKPEIVPGSAIPTAMVWELARLSLPMKSCWRSMRS
jgi:Tol biopolymer transport system component